MNLLHMIGRYLARYLSMPRGGHSLLPTTVAEDLTGVLQVGDVLLWKAPAASPLRSSI